MSFGKKYNVDFVMCIDVTGSMSPIIDEVKKTALTLPSTFLATMDEYGRHVDSLRIKVIAFGDYEYDENPMAESEFFTADQAGEFETYVNNLVPSGGGDIPENALEALALAFKSDWDESAFRHVTLLFTDAPALPLGERAECPKYPTGMPATLDELMDWYQNPADQEIELKLKRQATRLVLFSPHAEPWDDISDWERYETGPVYHVPIALGAGALEIDINDIVGAMVHSSI